MMKNNAQKEVDSRDVLKRQARSGLSVQRFCAEQGVSEASFCNWRKKLIARRKGKSAPNLRPPKVGDANGDLFRLVLLAFHEKSSLPIAG
jgi:hypothetical protein